MGSMADLGDERDISREDSGEAALNPLFAHPFGSLKRNPLLRL